MVTVRTINDVSYYTDGFLIISKAKFCSHAEVELSISNDSCSVSLSHLLDPELFKHKLTEDDLVKLYYWFEDDSIFPFVIVFKSVEAYQACCKVLGITPDSYLVENGKTVISHEL